MQFLVQMRDGKPSQSISVTSTNINLNARDIETARAIVREIRGDAGIALSNGEGTTPANERQMQIKGETMLLGNEGGRKDG